MNQKQLALTPLDFAESPKPAVPAAISSHDHSPIKSVGSPLSIEQLQQRIRSLEKGKRIHETEVVSTGCTAFDRMLPEKGLARGTIIEWLSTGQGSGAKTLAMLAARQASAAYAISESMQTIDEQAPQGAVVIVDPYHQFYPPAFKAIGIDLKNTIVLRPQSRADRDWAIQQCLACPSVAAVVATVDHLDELAFRRFQLSAEESGCIGLFHRPASVYGKPSWSEIQIAVRSQPTSAGPAKLFRPQRSLQIELLRCRGGVAGAKLNLEIEETTGTLRKAVKTPLANTTQLEKEHEANSVHLAAQLAHPKTGRRAARA